MFWYSPPDGAWSALTDAQPDRAPARRRAHPGGVPAETPRRGREYLVYRTGKRRDHPLIAKAGGRRRARGLRAEEKSRSAWLTSARTADIIKDNPKRTTGASRVWRGAAIREGKENGQENAVHVPNIACHVVQLCIGIIYASSALRARAIDYFTGSPRDARGLLHDPGVQRRNWIGGALNDRFRPKKISILASPCSHRRPAVLSAPSRHSVFLFYLTYASWAASGRDRLRRHHAAANGCPTPADWPPASQPLLRPVDVVFSS
jgi:hypothetical protein